MASHPPELVHAASGTSSEARRVAIRPGPDLRGWAYYRPTQTDEGDKSPVNFGTVDETGSGAPDVWMKFLREHEMMTESPSPQRATALPAHRFPTWFNVAAALSVSLLVLSPLLIFWSVQSAVLMTAVALGVVITLGDAAVRMRARHREREVARQ
jgi:hypothetical protein